LVSLGSENFSSESNPKETFEPAQGSNYFDWYD
jgi:hypothetical protein